MNVQKQCISTPALIMFGIHYRIFFFMVIMYEIKKKAASLITILFTYAVKVQYKKFIDQWSWDDFFQPLPFLRANGLKTSRFGWEYFCRSED